MILYLSGLSAATTKTRENLMNISTMVSQLYIENIATTDFDVDERLALELIRPIDRSLSRVFAEAFERIKQQKSELLTPCKKDEIKDNLSDSISTAHTDQSEKKFTQESSKNNQLSLHELKGKVLQMEPITKNTTEKWFSMSQNLIKRRNSEITPQVLAILSSKSNEPQEIPSSSLQSSLNLTDRVKSPVQSAEEEGPDVDLGASIRGYSNGKPIYKNPKKDLFYKEEADVEPIVERSHSEVIEQEENVSESGEKSVSLHEIKFPDLEFDESPILEEEFSSDRPTDSKNISQYQPGVLICEKYLQNKRRSDLSFVLKTLDENARPAGNHQEIQPQERNRKKTLLKVSLVAFSLFLTYKALSSQTLKDYFKKYRKPSTPIVNN